VKEFEILPNNDLSPSPVPSHSPEALAAPDDITPQKLINMVAASGNVDKLATLLDLKLRWDAAESKRKFDNALETFRQNKVVIKKTKEVVIATRGGDEMRYNHAELDKAAEIVEDALAEVGLTYTWKPVANPEGKPQMSLILRGFGHTEEMGTLVGPPDTSGGKNNMQAIGSSTTYLARYVLFYSLGIVPKGKDDDGRMATGGMSEQAIDEYCQTIKDASTLDEAKIAFGKAWKLAEGDQATRNRFKAVWEAKKVAAQEVKRG
jgi:hypothetical protein